MTADAAPANAGFASLDALVRPRSVAIIGASDEPARIGGRPIAYMKERGFQGEIWPVNPKRATVQGLPAFASVEALPARPTSRSSPSPPSMPSRRWMRWAGRAAARSSSSPPASPRWTPPAPRRRTG